MADLIGSYDPLRRPWVVQVYDISPTTLLEVLTATYTPDSPGPLVGEWALTVGPLGDSRYGEIKTSVRPGWRTDQTRLRIWEQPDTSKPADFYGVVGIVTGSRRPEEASYSVPLQGLYDLIAEAPIDDISFYAGVLRAGVEGLPYRRGETVDEYHKRVLAPFTDGTVGIQPDGTLVVGRPIATEANGVPVRPVSLAATDAEELEDGMAERLEVVTDVIASPGPRWAARRVKRSVPTGRRRLTTVVDDRMKTPKVDRAAPVNFLGIFRTSWGQTEQLGAVLSSPPQAYIATQQQLPDPQTLADNTVPTAAEVPFVTLRVRLELPLSAIVRGSATSELAVDALYDLHTLTTGITLWYTPSSPPPALPASYDLLGESLSDFGTFNAREWLAVGAQEWDQIPDAQKIDSWSYRLLARDATLRAVLTSAIREEMLREVFLSIGGGTYTYVLDGVFRFPAAYRWGRRRAGVSAADVPNEYLRVYQSGAALALVTPPVMNVDALVDTIPAALLPTGWDVVNSSAATAQGRFPGIVRPPARVTGLAAGALPMTELRYERGFGALSTSWQAGARSAQALSAAEDKARRSTVGKV